MIFPCKYGNMLKLLCRIASWLIAEFACSQVSGRGASKTQLLKELCEIKAVAYQKFQTEAKQAPK